MSPPLVSPRPEESDIPRSGNPALAITCSLRDPVWDFLYIPQVPQMLGMATHSRPKHSLWQKTAMSSTQRSTVHLALP